MKRSVGGSLSTRVVVPEPDDMQQEEEEEEDEPVVGADVVAN